MKDVEKLLMPTKLVGTLVRYSFFTFRRVKENTLCKINITFVILYHFFMVYMVNNSFIGRYMFKIEIISIINLFILIINLLLFSGMFKLIQVKYYSIKFRRIINLLGGDVSIVNIETRGSLETITLNSYVPINKVIKEQQAIEHFLNTNIIEIKQARSNKKIINLVCSTDIKVSKYSGAVNKLTEKLYKLGYIIEVISFDETDFVYCLTCKVTKVGKEVEAKEILNKSNELAFTIGNPLLVEAENGKFIFRINKADINIYYFHDYIGALQNDKKYHLPMLIGLSYETGKPIFLDLAEVLHTFITGITNSGKSCCFNDLIQSLLAYRKDNIAMINVDFKRIEFFDYQFIKNCIYMHDIEQFKKLLKFVRIEIDKRFKEFKNIKNIQDYNENRNIKMPYLIICIDEVAFISTSGNGDLFDELIILINMGRACGIIFICATQRPEHTVCPTNFRNQFESIFVGRLARTTDNSICGIDKDIETPKFKTGEFVYRSVKFNGKIQSLFIDDKKANYVYESLKNCSISCNKIETNDIVSLDKKPELNEEAKKVLNNIKKPSSQVLSLIEEIKNCLMTEKEEQKDIKIGYSGQDCTRKEQSLYMVFENILRDCNDQDKCPTYTDMMGRLNDDQKNRFSERNFKEIKRKAYNNNLLYKENNGKFYVNKRGK